MQCDPISFISGLPTHLQQRVRALNRRPIDADGEFVLYWMHHAVRGHENPALDVALLAARQINLPVLVYQGVGGRHLYNSDRHHTFIMEGARDAQRELILLGISCCFHLARDPHQPSPIAELAKRAALVLTEDFPVPPFTIWSRRLASFSTAAFWAVDTTCVLPMQAFKKPYARAYQFRNDAWAEFEKRLSEPYGRTQPESRPFRGRLGFEAIDLESADIAELCSSCCIDHIVGPVPHTQGGSAAGYRRWEAFKRSGLEDYDRRRNDAAATFPAGVSRMSAYLHHGHVSPFRIARETASSGAGGAGKFLDEFLVWRELAHNFCFHHPHPESLSALPAWAVKTLNDHRKDSRHPVFTWEQLARANTGDPLWDAAQKSLLIHGELHNNVRMTWGKAILQWTRSPEEALKMMIELNHRYALDGSDPNSYGGILWCLGLFDRPFKPEKKVIGSLRPRSTRSHAARFDLSKYTARVFKPAASTKILAAVVGAGLSGLVAARTLADHGHDVRVFEKARGPGGRMATRRIDAYAFDHGAQYFTVRDQRFRRYVDSWMQTGLVRLWEGRIRVVKGGEIHKEHRAHDRLVGVPGMSAIARHLAESLEVCYGTRVKSVCKPEKALVLTDEDGNFLGAFDVLILTAPPEQSAGLAQGLTPLADRAAAVCMLPCWAVMAAFEKSLALPYDGLFVHDADITWAARNSSKPGRGNEECWVLHADPVWSAGRADLASEEVARLLTDSFFSVAGGEAVKPVFSTAHRWRHARAHPFLEVGCLWDPRAMIGLCGDWCSGSRIEGAFLSGAAMAGRVLGAIAQEV